VGSYFSFFFLVPNMFLTCFITFPKGSPSFQVVP
jgi:hypothetical protein